MAAPADVAIGTRFGVKGSHWIAGYHTGVDFLTPVGTTLHAPVDSTITHVGRGGWGPAYGIHVIGRGRGTDGKTYEWITAHMSSTSVRVGDKVDLGDVLGKSGATGNVTGPHCHFEVRRSPYGYWQHVNPKVLLDVTVKPKGKRPEQWFRLIGANLGTLNAFGEKTATKRLPAVVSKIARSKPQVVCVQELKGAFVDDFDRLMRARGYRRVAGDLARYIYVAASVKFIEGGVFDLQPRYKGDTKQAAWAVLVIDGKHAIVTSGHLENEDASSTTQVKQAGSLIKQTAAVRTEFGIGRDREIHELDGNSNSRVRLEAFGKAGFSDASDVAYESIGSRLGTFLDWRKTATAGPRIDLIQVGPGRPVRRYFVLRPGWLKSTNSNAIDHLIVCADIGKQV